MRPSPAPAAAVNGQAPGTLPQSPTALAVRRETRAAAGIPAAPPERRAAAHRPRPPSSALRAGSEPQGWLGGVRRSTLCPESGAARPRPGTRP